MTGPDVPAGVRATAESPAPAGNQTGGDGAARWKAAIAAHNAAQRRGRHRRAARQPGPGMNRRPPPGPPDAA